MELNFSNKPHNHEDDDELNDNLKTAVNNENNKGGEEDNIDDFDSRGIKFEEEKDF